MIAEPLAHFLPWEIEALKIEHTGWRIIGETFFRIQLGISLGPLHFRFLMAVSKRSIASELIMYSSIV